MEPPDSSDYVEEIAWGPTREELEQASVNSYTGTKVAKAHKGTKRALTWYDKMLEQLEAESTQD